MHLRYCFYLLLLLMTMTTIGCARGADKERAFEKMLKAYKQDPAYNAVQAEAKSKLTEWIAAGIRDVQILKECAWKLDDAVFFNSRKDRACLLLPIQDNLKDAELDYVYVMHAAREDGKWHIYFAGLPNLVFQRKDFGNEPITLNKLSQLARAELLKSYLDSDGKVNDAFVDAAYTDDLRAKHEKFLNNR